MVTADHPNKKVKALPKMLVQAFPVKIIGFSEKGNSQSTKNLHDMNLEYNLYPPVSGPAIERIVLKIKKDNETKEQQAKERAATKQGGDAENPDQVITFKGDTTSGDALKASFDQARAALSQLVNSDGQEEDPNGSGATGTSSTNSSNASSPGNFENYGSVQNPGNSPAEGGAAYNPLTAGGQQSGQSSGPGYVPRQSSDPNNRLPDYNGNDPRGNMDSGPIGGGYAAEDARRKNGQNQRNRFDKDGHPLDPSDPNYQEEDVDSSLQDSTEGNDSPSFNANDLGPIGGGYASAKRKKKKGIPLGKDGKPLHPSETNSADEDESANEANEQESENAGFMEGKSNWGKPGSKTHNRGGIDSDDNPDNSDPAKASENSSSAKSDAARSGTSYGKNKVKMPYTFETEREKTNPQSRQSIILKGSQIALQETANLKGIESAKQVARSSDIACITVESPRFSGYLVCAFGQNRKVDKQLIDLLKFRLLKFLKDNGEEIKDQETMLLKITEIDFTSWTLSQAEFLKKSVHEGDEIAIAFFPTDIRNLELSDSISEKMVQIRLDDLKEDAKVEFDLYIFMPENNKYLLYTPQGRHFYDRQKTRLKDKGISHMHLRKESAHEVKKYQAQNFLNEKIAAFTKPKQQSA